MWNYEKMLQYPVKISKPDPASAKIIMTQFGGPDGELGASMRYLSQRYTMPYKEVIGILTDIGTYEGKGLLPKNKKSPPSLTFKESRLHPVKRQPLKQA